MLGNHEEAGRPSPFTKTMRCFLDDGCGLMAGKKMCEIGAEGLLGIERNSGEGTVLLILDAMLMLLLVRKRFLLHGDVVFGLGLTLTSAQTSKHETDSGTSSVTIKYNKFHHRSSYLYIPPFYPSTAEISPKSTRQFFSLDQNSYTVKSPVCGSPCINTSYNLHQISFYEI